MALGRNDRLVSYVMQLLARVLKLTRYCKLIKGKSKQILHLDICTLQVLTISREVPDANSRAVIVEYAPCTLSDAPTALLYSLSVTEESLPNSYHMHNGTQRLAEREGKGAQQALRTINETSAMSCTTHCTNSI